MKSVLLAAAVAVTNQFLMVDQDGNLNASGVATVSDIATNAVAVQVAYAKATAAEEAAGSVTNALDAVVQNIMNDNVVVYRYGYTDSFSALVVFTDSDTCVICDFAKVKATSSEIVVRIRFCSSVALRAVKPKVMARNSLDGLQNGREDFSQVPDANVESAGSYSQATVASLSAAGLPTGGSYYTAEPTVMGGTTYSGFYEICVTVPNPVSTTSYFYWIKLVADTPSGDGATLDVHNGITGGVSGNYQFGTHVLHFGGGILTNVTSGAVQ